MASKYFLESKTVSRVDKDTGEITQTEVTKLIKINIGKQEEFYMTYCSYLSSIYQLTYADDIKLMVKLCEWGQFDTGNVQLTSARRIEISDELGMHNANISKSLKRLKEKKLINGEKGAFQINPAIFWKGDKAVRKDLLKKAGLNVIFNFQLDNDYDYD
jgi:hypothetical protein